MQLILIKIKIKGGMMMQKEMFYSLGACLSVITDGDQYTKTALTNATCVKFADQEVSICQ